MGKRRICAKNGRFFLSFAVTALALVSASQAWGHTGYDSLAAIEPAPLEIAYFVESDVSVSWTLIDQLKLAEKGLAEMSAPAPEPYGKDSRNDSDPMP